MPAAGGGRLPGCASLAAAAAMGGIRGAPNPIRQPVGTQLGCTASAQDLRLDSDQFDDFPLALFAQTRRRGLVSVAAVTTICRTTSCYSGAGCVRDGSRG